jgi:putative FmdB family regulatory protein
VPTYEYECDKCREVFEIRQRISEPALTTHENCGGAVRRLLSPAPFILKGDGWYVTDYPSDARKKGVEAEKSGTGSGSTAKSETKSDTKSETKSETTSSGAESKPAATATSTTSGGSASSASSASSST